MQFTNEWRMYVVPREEYEQADSHPFGWHMAMARWARWDRLTMGRPLKADSEKELARQLLRCSYEIVPIWALALEPALGEDRGKRYGLVRSRLEGSDEEWQELYDMALEGGIDYMLDNYCNGVPVEMILGR